MHNGVEENRHPPPFIPFAYPLVRLFCETGAYRQKLRWQAKGWVKREEREIDWRRQTFVSEEA